MSKAPASSDTSAAAASPLQAFPPLVRADSRLLILGSMPSVESLRKQQYYGHTQNTFWRILHDLWDQPLPADYARRTGFLLDHQLALWDVLASCRRTGSADTLIRDGSANDFPAFFQSWPRLRWICFNGQAAARLFDRLVLRPNSAASPAALKPGLMVFQLGSTSPAHAVPYASRLQEWRLVRELLK